MGRGRTKGTTTNVKIDPERLTNARILKGYKTDQEIVEALRTEGITESTISNARYHKNINADSLHKIAEHLNVNIAYLSGTEKTTFDQLVDEALIHDGYYDGKRLTRDIVKKYESEIKRLNRFDNAGVFCPPYDSSDFSEENSNIRLNALREYLKVKLKYTFDEHNPPYKVIKPDFTVNDLSDGALLFIESEIDRTLERLIDTWGLPVSRNDPSLSIIPSLEETLKEKEGK